MRWARSSLRWQRWGLSLVEFGLFEVEMNLQVCTLRTSKFQGFEEHWSLEMVNSKVGVFHQFAVDLSGDRSVVWC